MVVVCLQQLLFLRGWVCSSFRWFYASLNRVQAEDMLCRIPYEGAFLVRQRNDQRSVNDSSQFAISFRYATRILWIFHLVLFTVHSRLQYCFQLSLLVYTASYVNFLNNFLLCEHLIICLEASCTNVWLHSLC